MLKKIEQIKKEILSFQSRSIEEAESFRLRYLSKKGIIPGLFDALKALPPEHKKELGQNINEIKDLATKKLKRRLILPALVFSYRWVPGILFPLSGVRSSIFSAVWVL